MTTTVQGVCRTRSPKCEMPAKPRETLADDAVNSLHGVRSPKCEVPAKPTEELEDDAINSLHGDHPEVQEFGKKHGLTSEALGELQALMAASISVAQKRVAVTVPATIAHLGSGLESVGLAVDIWDEFVLEYADSFSVETFGPTGAGLPRSEKNLVVVGASCAFKAAGRPVPELRFTCTHRIPFGKGLGGASASFIGGFLAGSVLVSEEQMTLGAAVDDGIVGDESPEVGGRLGREFEGISRIPSQSDAQSPRGRALAQGEDKSGLNRLLLQKAVERGFGLGFVCPQIYGSLQIGIDKALVGCRSHRVPVPNGMVLVIFVPDDLGEGVPLPDGPIERKAAIFNAGRVALLINCFMTNEFEGFTYATEGTLAQDHSVKQFPYILPTIQAAIKSGAAGACSCGYGPSVLALITGRCGDMLAQTNANFLERSVAQAMISAASGAGINGQVLIAKPAENGAHVVANKSELGGGEEMTRISYYQ